MPLPRSTNKSSKPEKLPDGVSFWAKTTPEGEPGISVVDHCLNVGTVALTLLRRVHAPRLPFDPERIAALAAAHDIGKISPGFQSKCPQWLCRQGLTKHAVQGNWSSRETDHAKVSQQTVEALCRHEAAASWAPALGAHHGRPKGVQVPGEEPWLEYRGEALKRIREELGPLPDQKPPSDALLWWAAGLITVADWIGSDERFFPPDASLNREARVRSSEEALDRIGWRLVRFRPDLEFSDMFPGFNPNALQQAAIETIKEPGLYIIEGPMGCGKTEAALAAAYNLLATGKASGLFFGLPTQLTSNRIHRRVAEFVNRITTDASRVRLAHSSSWLLQQDLPFRPRNIGYDENARPGGEEDFHSWFASPRRALLEPFGVGTADQALLGVIAVKHFFLRQFGLARKVVILDEVHSYDLYTGALIDTLVQALLHLNSTVIILSATLTRQRRAQLLGIQETNGLSSAYPLLSAQQAPAPREVPCPEPASRKVHVVWRQEDELVEAALEKAKQGACVLWIRNTVAEAQATFRRLKSANQEGGPRLGLLHSRFPLARREELENEWMEALGRNGNRPDGCILVATQVVEQSVDVDADLLITDLAPSDMLFQRLGRLYRHQRPARPTSHPEIWIRIPEPEDVLETGSSEDIREALGRSARVYAPYTLLRTWRVWRHRTEVRLPAEIRPLLESTYDEPCAAEPESWCRFRQQLLDKAEILRGLAGNATRVLDLPSLKDDEQVLTRHESVPTAMVLLVKDVDAGPAETWLTLLNGERVCCRGAWEFEAARAIHRQLIRAPEWPFRAHIGKTPFLEPLARNVALGILQYNGEIAWYPEDAPSGLTYSEEIGLCIEHRPGTCPPGKDVEVWDESCF